MQEAEQARVASREAIDDVTPPALRDAMDERLADASMLPGALTILSARAVSGDAGSEEVVRRAAGVQLIYEGLSLTRALVADEPWGAAAADAPEAEIDADMDVLAADVLVSRGFRLLARTDASGDAVETVREFGRERTDAATGRGTDARSLEVAVFELAAVAGATAAGSPPPLPLRQYVVGLARSADAPSLAPADEVLPEAVEETMTRVGRSAEGRAKSPSATDS